MKNNRGITLMSLVIYITTLTIVLAILTSINLSFTNNYGQLKKQGEAMIEFNRFNAQLLKDIKTSKTSIITPNTETFENEDTFTLDNGATYYYDITTDAIYRDKIKICSNVSQCSFSKRTIEVNNTKKEILKIDIDMNKTGHNTREIEYVLRYY